MSILGSSCADCGDDDLELFACVVEAFETYDTILCDDCFEARNEEWPHPNGQLGVGA